MAIAFGSAGARTNITVAGTSWSLAYPAGITAGDLLVIHIVTSGGNVTMSSLTGWTEVHRETTVTNPRGGVLIKVADGTESGSLSFTTTSTTGNAIMFRYTGVDTTTPLDAAKTSVANTATVTDIVLPSITTVTADTMLIYADGANSGSTRSSSVTGTERVDHGFEGGKAGAVYDEPVAAVGATGTRTIVLEAARANWGMMIALRPAAGVTAAAPTGIASSESFGTPKITTSNSWSFDDGTSDEWTPSTAGAGTTAVTTSAAHDGAYGISANVPAATVDKAGFVLDYTPSQQVTIRGWWKVTAEGGSGSNVPFARLFYGTQRLADVYRQNASAGANVWLRVVQAIGGSNYYFIPTGFRLELDTWVYVSFTWGLDGQPKLWINGVQYLGSADAPADWFAAPQIDRAYLGTHEQGNAGAWSMDSVDLLTNVPAVAGEVRNEPLLSGQAFGSPSVSTTAPPTSPTGIASSEAFGTPTVSALLVTLPAGVATGEAFGAPAASTALTASPTGIASAEAMGAPALTATLTASPAGIASAEAFGAQTVNTTVTASPSGIGTAQTFGTPTIAASIAMSPAGVATAQAFGAPSIGTSQAVTVTGIASAEAFGAPSVAMPLTASPVGIPTAEAFGDARAAASQIYFPDTVPTEEAFGAPTLSATLALSPAGIAGAAAFGSPTASVQDLRQTASPTGVPSAAAFGTPSIIGNRMVSPPGIGSLESFGTPKQTNVLVALPANLPSRGTAFGAPQVKTSLTAAPGGIATKEAVGQPVVLKIVLQVGPAGIASLESFGAPKAVGGSGVTPYEMAGAMLSRRYSGRLGEPGTTANKPHRWEGTLG